MFHLETFRSAVTYLQVRFSATVGHLSSYFALVFFYDLELDLDSAMVNQRAKYLGQSHLVQKVIVQSHTSTDCCAWTSEMVNNNV